jgi:hypothetical protein
LFLSRTPNVELREKVRKCHGLKSYERLWTEEVCGAIGGPSLVEIVKNWDALCKAFEARHILVHGRDRYTRKMVEPHIEALFESVRTIEAYCEGLGKPLNKRMPMRRKKKAL